MGTEAQHVARRRVKPMLLAHWLVRYPWVVIVFAFVVPIVCGGILQAQGALNLNEPTGNDYLITKEERVVRAHGLEAAIYDVSLDFGDLPTIEQRDSSKSTFLLLRSRQGNALTPDIVSKLRRLEDSLQDIENYEDHCFSNTAPDSDLCSASGPAPICAPPESITSIFYNCGDAFRNYPPLPQDEFDEIVNSKLFSEAGKPISPFSRLLSANASDGESRFVRSVLTFGLTVKGFDDEFDRETEQRQLFSDLSFALGDMATAESDQEVEILVFGFVYANAVFSEQALKDFVWAFASVTFVFVYLCIHTGSFYLGFMGILQIILAFPLTWFIYRNVFQVRYFAQLHILSVFLILGIGADDIFVFTDAWKQAPIALGPDCPLDVRMAWAYRRAAKAMLVTSFTTSMAFFVTAVSPIMPISTFGVWAACLIVLQFVLCITLYPANIIIWHRFWRYHSIWPLLRLAKRPELCAPNFREKEDIEMNQGSSGDDMPEESPSSDSVSPETTGASTANTTRGPDINNDETDSEYRIIERFFRFKWAPLVFRIRYVVIPVAAVLLGIAFWRASLLKPLSEEEVWLPDDNPTQRSSLWMEEEFPVAADNNQLVVDMVHGVAGVDRSEADRYDPLQIGDAVFDSEFTLVPAENQQYLFDLCKKIASSTSLDLADTLQPVTCFIEDFWKFNNNSFKTYDSEAALVSDLWAFIEFENDGGVQPYREFVDEGYIGISENEVLYTIISAATSIDKSLPYSKMNPVALVWEDLAAQFNEEAPPGLTSGYVTAGQPWSWTVTQNVLARSAITGIIAALFVAFLALVLSTLNVVIAVLAIVCIIGIVACTLGVMQILGWELGITESVASVIVVGFSVDYVVHIGNSYVESLNKSRFLRTRDALTDMGVSVIAGSISTMISGAFLWGAVIIFFHKFAAILVTTIAFSLFWSLIVFASLLMSVGPADNFGSLKPLVGRVSGALRKLISKKPRDDA